MKEPRLRFSFPGGELQVREPIIKESIDLFHRQIRIGKIQSPEPGRYDAPGRTFMRVK